MTNWYNRTILPRLLNSTMAADEFGHIRPAVVAHATGIVLEIGVGAGHNFPFYKNVSKLYALEPSRELAALAQEKARGLPFPVEFIYEGAEHIPLPDASVDSVVSTWTLCSVANPAQVLQEIKRVLKPQGRFAFVDHGLSPHTGTSFIQKAATPITKHFTGNCHMDRNIEQLVRDSGLHIDTLTHPKEGFKPLVHNYLGVATK